MIVLPSGTLYGPYLADVIRVIDGDTVEVEINYWPDHYTKISVRQFGINTPEKRTRDLREKILGFEATIAAEDFLKNKIVSVDDVEYGKFAGRVMGSIYADGESFGDYMLSLGLAREYYGGKRKSWFSQ